MEALGDDLLYGASAIAEFMFRDPKKRRRVYHLANKGELPLARMGEILVGRKSTLIAYVAESEREFAAKKHEGFEHLSEGRCGDDRSRDGK